MTTERTLPDGGEGVTAAQALAQALVAHQPRYYGEPGYWPKAAGELADGILAALNAAGWGIVPLIDFGDNSAAACPQQPDLFEESA